MTLQELCKEYVATLKEYSNIKENYRFIEDADGKYINICHRLSHYYGKIDIKDGHFVAIGDGEYLANVSGVLTILKEQT